LLALAKATLETSAAAMGRSLASAQAVGDALGRVFWEPLQAVGRLQDERRERGLEIVTRVAEALQADELTLALAPVLQEAQQQAVRLLAPERPPPPPPPPPGWKTVEKGEKDGLTAEGVRELLAELERKLAAGKNRRLKITWVVLEEEGR
jgi:hypothetical protein